jgi:hypothetical protein
MGHCHQTLSVIPIETSDGFKEPFLVGCQNFLATVQIAVSEFCFVTRRPAQNGQPEEDSVRSTTFACHTCPVSFQHCHQTRLFDPETMTATRIYCNQHLPES